MDFALTEEQTMFRDMFRDFAEKELAPLAEHTDRHEEPPVGALKKAAAQGFLGAMLPEEYGGAAMDHLTFCLLTEELAKHCLSTAVTLVMHNLLGALTILDAGTPEQKGSALPRLAEGGLAAFALTEPEAGADAAALQTTATADGETFVLDGVKTWVSSAGLAQLFVVTALTAPGQRRQGVSLFLLERDAPGLGLGARVPTLGLRGLDVRPVYLDEARAPAASLLGPLHQGWPLVQRGFSRVRLGLAAAALGAAEGALAMGVTFAAERKQFGVQIAHKQAIQNYIADSAIDIEALRHLVRYAAWQADAGQDFSRSASTAKTFGARVAANTANKMLQVHGGYGFSDEYPISRVYRDVRALRILGGTDEIQRYAVARDILEEKGLAIKP